MTKKEHKAFNTAQDLLSNAVEDLFDGYDEVTVACDATVAKVPGKAIRKALKKLSKANDKLRGLL